MYPVTMHCSLQLKITGTNRKQTLTIKRLSDPDVHISYEQKLSYELRGPLGSSVGGQWNCKQGDMHSTAGFVYGPKSETHQKHRIPHQLQSLVRLKRQPPFPGE